MVEGLNMQFERLLGIARFATEVAHQQQARQQAASIPIGVSLAQLQCLTGEDTPPFEFSQIEICTSEIVQHACAFGRQRTALGERQCLRQRGDGLVGISRMDWATPRLFSIVT